MKIETAGEIIEECFDRAGREIDELLGPRQGPGGDDCPCLSCNPPDSSEC
jgi:hypothetical protein